MKGGAALPPTQIYEPLVDKGDFGREFDGEDYPEFNWPQIDWTLKISELLFIPLFILIVYHMKDIVLG